MPARESDLGIWSEAAGGVIAGPFYTRHEAEEQVEDFIAEGEERDDLSIVELCPHEERPEDCTTCTTEQEDEE